MITGQVYQLIARGNRKKDGNFAEVRNNNVFSSYAYASSMMKNFAIQVTGDKFAGALHLQGLELEIKTLDIRYPEDDVSFLEPKEAAVVS